MVHKFDPGRMASLTSERRHKAVKPLELLQRAGVQAGESVLDWGCGAGFFILPAARLVGQAGRIVAVDIQPEMVTATQEAVAKAALANIDVMAAGEYELPAGLPAFDWVILAYILHGTRAAPPAGAVTEGSKTRRASIDRGVAPGNWASWTARGRAPGTGRSGGLV